MLPGVAEAPRDGDEPEVGDDGVAVLEEDVLGLEVLVHDAAVVEVPDQVMNDQRYFEPLIMSSGI